MNRQRHLTPALMIAAVLAAIFSVQSAEAAQAVVTLPRVDVVASRAGFGQGPAAFLPRVTVIGKRAKNEPARSARLVRSAVPHA